MQPSRDGHQMINPLALLVAILRLIVGLAGLFGLLNAGVFSVGALLAGNLVTAFADGALAFLCGFFGLWALFGERFIRLFAVSAGLHNQRQKLPPPSAASK